MEVSAFGHHPAPAPPGAWALQRDQAGRKQCPAPPGLQPLVKVWVSPWGQVSGDSALLLCLLHNVLLLALTVPSPSLLSVLSHCGGLWPCLLGAAYCLTPPSFPLHPSIFPIHGARDLPKPKLGPGPLSLPPRNEI